MNKFLFSILAVTSFCGAQACSHCGSDHGSDIGNISIEINTPRA